MFTNTNASAIDELVAMAKTKEHEKNLANLAQQRSYEEQEKIYAQQLDWKINELLGEVWDELAPFRTMSKNGSWVTYDINAHKLQLPFFSLVSNGDKTFIRTDQHGERQLENREKFAYWLMVLRQDYEQLKLNQAKRDQVEKLKMEFRAQLEKWLKKQDQIRAENARRLVEAQAQAKPFKVFNLEYSLIAGEGGERMLQTRNVPVLDEFPDRNGYWSIVHGGRIDKKKFYFQIAISGEPIEIIPGKDQNQQYFPNICGVVHTPAGILYYGLYDLIDELVPEFLGFYSTPELPSELDPQAAQELIWEYERIDSRRNRTSESVEE